MNEAPSDAKAVATEQLFQACSHTVLDQDTKDFMRAKLAEGADIHARNASGCTLLHTAAIGGCVWRCQFLMDAGADVHAMTNDGVGYPSTPHQPIHMAAMHGNADAVRVLHQAGADLDGHDNSEPPMVYAVRFQRYKTLMALLDLGANPNRLSRLGRTPMEEAVHWSVGGSELSVRITGVALLAFGGVIPSTASVYAKRTLDWPLHAAARWGDASLCIKLLERGFDPLAKDPSRKAPAQIWRSVHGGSVAAGGPEDVERLLLAWAAAKQAQKALSEIPECTRRCP